MKYTFKCPACGHVVEVEAENDDDAVMKLNEKGAEHAKQVHPDMPPTSEEEMTAMVKKGMQKS